VSLTFSNELKCSKGLIGIQQNLFKKNYSKISLLIR
jgi:hypothetical protein